MTDKLKYAKLIIDLESQAISQLSNSIDSSFIDAVDALLALSKSGRVVVSGMGKAGFVGMKISATLASTGVPSFFLHPAEAVHGDLGRYTKDDIALVLSNSGETEEVLRMIPFLKQTGCKIISITGNTKSNLRKYSDISLFIGELSEAGPLGLAPTTSTSVMLALGDALAMTVLKNQNFTREQFAQNHPGGNLGASLIPVKDLMRTGTEICIAKEEENTKSVIQKVVDTKNRAGAAIVINNQGELTGVLTDGDLKRKLIKSTDFLNEPIANIMTCNPKSINEESLVADALKMVTDYKIDEIIVVNSKNQPVGLLDIQDVLLTKK